MSLHGTLDTLSIAEILNMLESREKTGALVVDGNFGSGTLYVKEGRLVAGEAPGLLFPPESQAQLEALLVDVCFELMRQERGAFDFSVDAAAEWDMDRSFAAQDIVKTAQAAIDDWASISSVVPDMNVPLALAPNLSDEKITFNAAAWEIIAAIDGHRGVTQLAAFTEQSRIEVARALVSFIQTGAVVVVEAQSESGASEDVPAETPSHTDAEIAEALIASLTDNDDSEIKPNAPTKVEIIAKALEAENASESDEDEEADSELPAAEEGASNNPDRGALLRMFSSLREP